MVAFFVEIGRGSPSERLVFHFFFRSPKLLSLSFSLFDSESALAKPSERVSTVAEFHSSLILELAKAQLGLRERAKSEERKASLARRIDGLWEAIFFSSSSFSPSPQFQRCIPARAARAGA